jgi:uncharacterized protein (DUF1810 family)
MSGAVSNEISKDDPYGLERFVVAQDHGGTYGRAIEELRRGRKSSHWMWFVFPQIAGLGMSDMSRRFAISSLQESRAYLQHAILGPRLIECARAVIDLQGESTEEILGGIDAQKLRSSMTLFMRAAPDEPVFAQVLELFYDNQPDPLTDELI